jgi:hypothetical protein
MIFMKKRTPFGLIAFYSLLLIVVLSACKTTPPPCPPCPGLCPACKSISAQLQSQYQIATMSFQKTKHSHDWIILDITFRQNTDEEFRENAVRAIEKMWIKDAAPFSKNGYPNISVTKFPFSDTLKFQLRLLR